MSAHNNKLPMKRWACVVMIGLAWTLTVIGVAINIRNGQRLSLDVYGWFLQGIVIGALSVAPVAVMSWAGYQWAGRRYVSCVFGFIIAMPLVFFNWWSSNEFMGDQMLGHIRQQEDKLEANKELAEKLNDEILRSKRETEAKLLSAWLATKDGTEKARIKKELDSLRAETPELKAASPERSAGARASWLSKKLGWDRETIEGVTPALAPILMQIVEVFFSLMGFASWPRGGNSQSRSGQGEFNEFTGNRGPKLTRSQARSELLRMTHTGEVVGSNKEMANRWGVRESTASTWLSEFRREGLCLRERNGKSLTIRARINGNGGAPIGNA